MLLALLACTPPTPTPTPGTPDPTTGTGPTDTQDTDPTGTMDTAPPAPTGDTGPDIDCSVLPVIPPEGAPYDTFTGWGTAEDFDIDGAGFHVAVVGQDLRGRLPDGTIQIISPNVGGFGGTAGTRVMVDGNWVVANVGAGSLMKITTATGGQETLVGGLEYPNGVEVGRDGYVYVAENNANRVRQVDPATGEWFPVAEGLNQSNGLILSPDEQILYVGSFGSGKVWGVPRLGETTWDEPFVLADQGGFSGGFDGVNVDICGNVYITEYLRGIVWRIKADGSVVEELVNLPSSWIPNMRWGHDIGGWESDVLYVADRDAGRIFAVHPGIEGKKHVLLP